MSRPKARGSLIRPGFNTNRDTNQQANYSAFSKNVPFIFILSLELFYLLLMPKRFNYAFIPMSKRILTMEHMTKKEFYYLRQSLREAVIAIEENKRPKGFLYGMLNEVLCKLERYRDHKGGF